MLVGPKYPFRKTQSRHESGVSFKQVEKAPECGSFVGQHTLFWVFQASVLDEGWQFRLTLKMDVLVLMHLPVHVGVGVRVDVRVDFGVDFGRDAGSGLAEEQLLLGQVVLVVQAVFVRAGRAGGRRRAAPLSVRHAVGALRRRGAGRRAVLPALAEPQQDRGEDEDYSSRDADDDGPGEGAGVGWEQGDGRLTVCKGRKHKYGRS